MILRPSFPVTLVIAFFLTSLWAAAADDYAIKFDRPMKVGDRFSVTSRGTQSQIANVTAGDRALPEKREALTAELSADVEVLAVSPKGKPRKVRLTATRLTVETDGRSNDAMPRSTEVIVEFVDKKSKYSIGGLPAGEQARKALALVFALSSDETSDDVIFGTEQRQSPGKRWPMNAAPAAKSLSATFGGRFAPEDLQGGCQLQEVVQAAGGSALRITGEFAVSELKIPLPNGLKIRRGSLQSKLSCVIPVDPSKGTIQQGTEVDVEFLADGENAGTNFVVSTLTRETVDIRYTYK